MEEAFQVFLFLSVASLPAFVFGFSASLVSFAEVLPSVPRLSGAAGAGISGRNESKNLPGSISTSSFLAIGSTLYDAEYFFRKGVDAAPFRQCLVRW